MTSPNLSIRCLGEPLALNPQGVPIALRVRKHLAVLLYLALDPRRRATRERLQKLLWPEGKSSQSLSQALVELRRGLGDGALDVSDHWIAISPRCVIETDLERIEASDPETLVGELVESGWSTTLLDGFHFDNAEEWNQWLATERHLTRERLSVIADAALEPSQTRSLTRLEIISLRQWRTRLTASAPIDHVLHTPATITWHDLDDRVEKLATSLRALPRRTTLYTSSTTNVDKLCIALAALGRAFRTVTFVSAGETYSASLPELCGRLLMTRGIAGVDPAVHDVLGSTHSGKSFSEVDAYTAVCEALRTLAADKHTVLLLRCDPHGSTLATRLARDLHEDTPLTVLLVDDGANICAPSSATPLRIPDSTATRTTGVLYGLSTAGVDLSPEQVCRISADFIGVEAYLHAIQAQHEGVCTTIDALASVVDGGTRRWLLAALSERDSKRLLYMPPTSEPRAPAGVDLLVRASTIDEATDSEQSLLELILYSTDARLLDAAEGLALRQGGASDNLLAVLLLARASNGMCRHEDIAQVIRERLARLECGHAPLSPVESLCYSTLASSSAIAEALLDVRALRTSMLPAESPVSTAARLKANLIVSQILRDRREEGRLLTSISEFTFGDNRLRLHCQWAAAYGCVMRAMQAGRYEQAYRMSEEALRLAIASGDNAATRTTYRTRLTSAYRLGFWHEAAGIARQLGRSHFFATTKKGAVHVVYGALAAHRSGLAIRWLDDLVEEHFVGSRKPRSMIYGADYLHATSRFSRASSMAAAAIEQTGTDPIAQEEGTWARWAARHLDPYDARSVIEAIICDRPRVDVRERAMAALAMQELGAMSPRLRERSLGVSLPPSALIT